MIQLPELPTPDVDYWGDFTADLMQAYGRACYEVALEDAAKVCESVDNHANPMTANDCADTIRALKRIKA